MVCLSTLSGTNCPALRKLRNFSSANARAAGVRVLTRTEETGEEGDAIRHSGRVIKVLDRQRQRQIGVFRALADGRGRLVPVSKREALVHLAPRDGEIA